MFNFNGNVENKNEESTTINFQPMPKRFMVWNDIYKHFLEFKTGYTVELFDIADWLGLLNLLYIGENATGEKIVDIIEEKRKELLFCQSTNLFDKDGKEIFEGSIVEVDEKYNWGNGDNDRYFFGEVTNHKGRWCVNAMCGEDELMQPLCEIRPKDITITGHILSSPELLEENK